MAGAVKIFKASLIDTKNTEVILQSSFFGWSPFLKWLSIAGNKGPMGLNDAQEITSFGLSLTILYRNSKLEKRKPIIRAAVQMCEETIGLDRTGSFIACHKTF